jgi:hypothetical protein
VALLWIEDFSKKEGAKQQVNEKTEAATAGGQQGDLPNRQAGDN